MRPPVPYGRRSAGTVDSSLTSEATCPVRSAPSSGRGAAGPHGEWEVGFVCSCWREQTNPTARLGGQLSGSWWLKAICQNSSGSDVVS